MLDFLSISNIYLFCFLTLFRNIAHMVYLHLQTDRSTWYKYKFDVTRVEKWRKILIYGTNYIHKKNFEL